MLAENFYGGLGARREGLGACKEGLGLVQKDRILIEKDQVLVENFRRPGCLQREIKCS